MYMHVLSSAVAFPWAKPSRRAVQQLLPLSRSGHASQFPEQVFKGLARLRQKTCLRGVCARTLSGDNHCGALLLRADILVPLTEV